MANGFRKFTIYDAMEARGEFDKNPANHEKQDYPKAIDVPQKLPLKLRDAKSKDYLDPSFLDDGSKHFDANGNLLATVEDGQWVAFPKQVVVKDEDEERKLMGLMPKHKDPAVKLEEDERTSLQSMCQQMGLQYDKRWGAPKLKELLEVHLQETAAA